MARGADGDSVALAPVGYERWVLQYRNGLDLDDPYYETEFETEKEHLEHAEYMLYGALEGSVHYDAPVSEENRLIPSDVTDVAQIYDAAVGLLKDLYAAAIPTDRYEAGEPGDRDLEVYAGCESLHADESIASVHDLSGIERSHFFVVGIAPERGRLLFRDRLRLSDLACREPAEMRRVHERIADGVMGRRASSLGG